MVSGGFPPYDYIWTNSAGDTISMDQDVSNLPAGDYGVMITDDMGTNVFSGMINVGQPAAALEITQTLVVQPTALDCNGGELTVVNIDGGAGGYTYLWSDEDGNEIGTGSMVSGLNGGIYFVVVTDANDCTDMAEFVLEDCEIELILLNIEQLSVTCNGDTDGMISVVAEGGTEPYTYDWDTDPGFSQTGIDGSSLEDLAPGTYEITATDANGVTTIGSYTIIEPAPIQVTVNVTPGRADAIALGGTAPYIYQWDQIITTEEFVEELQGGIEHVLLVTDANGCTSELYYFDTDYPSDCYEARRVISPNNDGLNDDFFIYTKNGINIVEFQVYNKWGEKMHDDATQGWDGTYRNSLMQNDAYVYVVKLEHPDGSEEMMKGQFLLIR